MFADETGRITRFSENPADLAEAQRLANRAILPGLVNAHSHAFQRLIRGRTEHRTTHRDTFWTWRTSMYCAANLVSPEALYQAARMAYLEMLLSGITTVGEFHYLHHGPRGIPYENRNLLALQLLRAAEETGLRNALLRSAYVRSGFEKPAEAAQARFITPKVDDFIADTESLRAEISDRCEPGAGWVGVAPHSIRAVPLDYLRKLIRYARASGLPVHMHVAEQPAEVAECLEEHGRTPVTLLHEQGLLDSRFTAVHSIHVTEQEIGYLAAARSAVCACPVTERNLGDGTAPADRWLNAGLRVCLGSDSNVQIDLLEEARSLEYDLRMQRMERVVLASDPSADSLAQSLLTNATEIGAQSLGAPGGKLEVGRAADFFTVDLNDPSIAGATPESLLNHVVFSLERTAIRDVCVGGKFIVRGGQHPRGEEIVQQFTSLQRNLWGPTT